MVLLKQNSEAVWRETTLRLTFKLTGALIAAGMGLNAISIHAEENQVSILLNDRVVDQKLYPDSINACGPTALLNSIKFGTPELHKCYQTLVGQSDATKLRFLIDRYFKGKPSTLSSQQKRWGFNGVYVQDLAQSYNDLLKENSLPATQSAFLDREKGESDRKHLERIHQSIQESIKAGCPPLLSLRSFFVKIRPNEKVGWNQGNHHFVVIISVPENLPATATGFEARIIEPNGGKLTSIHIHPEPNGQPFNVQKGNNLQGEWLAGRPFLLVLTPEIPSLKPANLKWSDRYLVTANYLIGRFSSTGNFF